MRTPAHAAIETPTASASAGRAIAPLRCPRCHYVLEGVASEWRTRCPLQGRCSECGLVFDWADVFDPRRQEPRWCVEFGSRLSVPWRIAATLGRTVVPWRFWGVRMSHPIWWSRLVVYVLVLAAVGYVVFAAGHALHCARNYPTLRRAVPGRVVVSNEQRIRAGALAFIEPFSARRGSVRYGVIPMATSSPRDMFRSRFGRRGQSAKFARSLLVPGILAALVPVLFVTVPVTRRRCRVRWRHLGRVALYSAPLVLAPIWIMLFTFDAGSRSWEAIQAWTLILNLVVSPIGLWIWWDAALRRYLKLAQPGLTAFLFVLTGMLILVVSLDDLLVGAILDALYGLA